MQNTTEIGNISKIFIGRTQRDYGIPKSESKLRAIVCEGTDFVELDKNSNNRLL